MSTVIQADGGVGQEPIANRFTPDAQEWMGRLRAMADAFPDESEPRALTPAEMRIARKTSAAALEKTAVFAEAGPAVGAPAANTAEIRDAIAFELAYGGVRDAARDLARRVDLAILRRKLKAVKSARGVYVMAKSYATLEVGEPVRSRVADMKRAFNPRARKKSSVAPAEQK